MNTLPEELILHLHTSKELRCVNKKFYAITLKQFINEYLIIFPSNKEISNYEYIKVSAIKSVHARIRMNETHYIKLYDNIGEHRYIFSDLVGYFKQNSTGIDSIDKDYIYIDSKSHMTIILDRIKLCLGGKQYIKNKEFINQKILKHVLEYEKKVLLEAPLNDSKLNDEYFEELMKLNSYTFKMNDFIFDTRDEYLKQLEKAINKTLKDI